MPFVMITKFPLPFHLADGTPPDFVKMQFVEPKQLNDIHRQYPETDTQYVRTYEPTPEGVRIFVKDARMLGHLPEAVKCVQDFTPAMAESCAEEVAVFQSQEERRQHQSQPHR